MAAVRGLGGAGEGGVCRLACMRGQRRGPAVPSGARGAGPAVPLRCAGGGARPAPQARGRVLQVPAAGGRARPGPALRWAPPSRRRRLPSGARGPRRRWRRSRWRPRAGWAAAWPPSGWRWPSTRWGWRCCWPACSPTCSSPTCSSTRAASASSSAWSGGCSGTRVTWRCRPRSCGTTWGCRRPRAAGTRCCGGWCTASASASPPRSAPPAPPTWSCSAPGSAAAATPSPAGSVEDTAIDITAPKSGGNAANYGKRFPTQNNRILSWNNLCKHCGLTIKWTRGAISLPNAPISVLDWMCFEMVKKDPTKSP